MLIEDNLKKCKTGDVLLFSSNTFTAFLLKTFVSTIWNHSGIVVRFIEYTDEEGNIKNKVSLTEEGKLYILETNTGSRKDDLFGDEIVGAGFSDSDWVFKKYNKISVRHLHDIFRTEDLSRLTMEFADKYRGIKFPKNKLPFISVWLGIPLTQKDKELKNNEMFCSELMAHYYNYCIGQQYEKITGIPYDEKLSTLFGSNSPSSEDMYTPAHYTIDKTPNSSIFMDNEEEIYKSYANLYLVIIQPIIIIIIISVLIWLTLP